MKKILGCMIVLGLFLTLSITGFAAGESDSFVSAGNSASFVVKNDGSLWGWGSEFVGNGQGYDGLEWDPVQILDNVKGVSAAGVQRAAVKKDNTLWVWGSLQGYYNGEQGPAYTKPVKALDDVEMVSVCADFMIILKTDGSVWVNNFLPGDGTQYPSEGFVKVMDGCKYVSAGIGSNAYVIKNDDTLWGWGLNRYAELGNRDTEDLYTPIQILEDVRTIHGNSTVVLAIRLDNSLYSWGAGSSEGIYTEKGWVDYAGTPYKVMDNVLRACASENGGQVAVIKTDHTLWAWGLEGSFVQSAQPTKLYDHAREMAIGERHIVVVFDDNTLGTAGTNYYKVLGHGDMDSWSESIPLKTIMDSIQDSPVSWAEKEVEEAIGLQLVPEDMQSNYEQDITREEFCILAVKLVEEKTGMTVTDYIHSQGLQLPEKSPFVDCNHPDVIAANVLKIVDGTSATTFAPDNWLTREQAAKVLSATARALGENIQADCPVFTDDQAIAGWSKPYIGYVYNANVMKGVGENKFNPKGGYQRQQAYMTILRLLKSLNSGIKSENETIVSSTEPQEGNTAMRNLLKYDSYNDEQDLLVPDYPHDILPLYQNAKVYDSIYDYRGGTGQISKYTITAKLVLPSDSYEDAVQHYNGFGLEKEIMLTNNGETEETTFTGVISKYTVKVSILRFLKADGDPLVSILISY